MIKDAGGRVTMRYERQYLITIESFGQNRPQLHKAKWFDFAGTTYDEWQTGWSVIPYDTLNASMTPAQLDALGQWSSDFKIDEMGFEINHIIPTQNTITSGTNLQLFTTPTNLPYLLTYIDINNRCPPTDHDRNKIEHSTHFEQSIPLERNDGKLKEWVFWDGILPMATDSGDSGQSRVNRNITANILNWEGFKTIRVGETFAHSFKPNTGWKIMSTKNVRTLSAYYPIYDPRAGGITSTTTLDLTYQQEQYAYGWEDTDKSVNNVATGLPLKTHKPNQAPAQDPERAAENQWDVMGPQYQLFDLKPKEPAHNAQLCLIRPQILWGKTGQEDLTFQALIK